MKQRARTGSPRGLFVGRYFDIEFYLHYSWFLIAAIVAYQLASDFFPHFEPGLAHSAYLLMGIGAAVLFFLSILLHELGHSLVSQRCGIPVPRITLLFIGGLAEIAHEPDDAKSELKIALGGPGVTCLLILLYALAGWLFRLVDWIPAAAVFEWLAVTNAVLIVFNMVPGFPLDGGRVLRALLWARSGRLRQSTYLTSRIGIGFSWLLIALGLYLLVQERQLNGFVFILIAVFLKAAAESGYANALHREVLRGVRVQDVMTSHSISIPDTLPLNLAVDEFFLAHHHVAYPVCTSEHAFRGLLRLEFLREVPREKWPYTSTGDLVAKNGAADLQINPEASAGSALRLLLAPGGGRLAVVENGKVVGMITRGDVLRIIEIRTELES